MSRFTTEDGEGVQIMKGLVLSRRQLIVAGLLIALLFAVPDLAPLHPLLQVSVIHDSLLWGLTAVGLNLLLRHLRLYSFGHGVFFGGGAFTAAVLASKYDVTALSVLILAAVLIALILGALFGYLIRNSTALVFGLLTLAFGQVIFATIISQRYFNFTDGLPVRPGEGRASILGITFEPDVFTIIMYYLSVFVLIIGLIVMYRIARSPFGAALDAIGQNRTRARFIGIRLGRYVWIAFIISGIYGGVAGGLYAVSRQHVLPEPTLSFFASGEILFMAVLGGYQTLIGPVVGGLVLVGLNFIGPNLTGLFNALTGVVLLLLVFVFPKGIVGSIKVGLDQGIITSLRLWIEQIRESVTRSVQKVQR